MTRNVLPFHREGLWLCTHGSYYASAYSHLQEFDASLAAIRAKHASLSNETLELPEDLRWGFLSHETKELEFDLNRSYVAAIINACMTLEAFLNYYGVKRLGEDYYQRNLERLGITEKFSLLHLACHGVILTKSDAANHCLREMFDRRNQLVHPKAREFSLKRLEESSKGNPPVKPLH